MKSILTIEDNPAATAAQRLAQQIVELRQSFQTLGIKEEQSRVAALLRLSVLVHLRRLAHGIACSAATDGLLDTAQVASALEALFNELHTTPAKLNPSSMRTIAQAIDLLGVLPTEAPGNEKEVSVPHILVVDDEPISRQTICVALKRVNLTPTTIDESLLAVALLNEKRFDVVFLDVEMPGLNGFELCEKLRVSRANAKTPVVFVTALTDFQTRAHSNLSGGTDFIAKPVVLMELAVKALTHLVRSRMRPA